LLYAATDQKYPRGEANGVEKNQIENLVTGFGENLTSKFERESPSKALSDAKPPKISIFYRQERRKVDFGLPNARI